MTTELSNFHKRLREIINEHEDKESLFRDVAALVDIHIVYLYKNISQFMEEMEEMEKRKNKGGDK